MSSSFFFFAPLVIYALFRKLVFTLIQPVELVYCESPSCANARSIVTVSCPKVRDEAAGDRSVDRRARRSSSAAVTK